MGMAPRYSPEQTAALIDTFHRDGFCTLKGLFPREKLQVWRTQFQPLFDAHVEREGHKKNRGNGRFYVTLPFVKPWADPEIFENEDVLQIIDKLVGPEPIMVQLATDTPVLGSEY